MTEKNNLRKIKTNKKCRKIFVSVIEEGQFLPTISTNKNVDESAELTKFNPKWNLVWNENLTKKWKYKPGLAVFYI